MKRFIAIGLMLLILVSTFTSCESILSELGLIEEKVSGTKISDDIFWTTFDQYLTSIENNVPEKWKMTVTENGDTLHYTVISSEEKTTAYFKAYELSKWYTYENDTYTIMISDEEGKRYSITDDKEVVENIYINPEQIFQEYFSPFSQLQGMIEYSYSKITYTQEKNENVTIYKLYAKNFDEELTISFNIEYGKMVTLSMNMYGVASIKFIFGNKVPNIVVPSIDEYTLVDIETNEPIE